MRELPQPDPHHVFVGCDYCRNQERLPAELAARVQVLRARLQQLSAAKDALGGPAKLVAQLTDSRRWLPSMLVPLAALLLQVPSVLTHLRATLANPSIPLAVRAEVLSAQLSAPAYVVGIVLGMLLALIVTRWHYQRALRPHYMARAPVQEGMPTRCRCCGGDLAPAPGAFSTCRHCGAQNLVSREIAEHRVELLQREAAEYSARAQSASSAVHRAAASSSRIYLLCWGVGMCIGLGLGYAARTAAVYVMLNYELAGSQVEPPRAPSSERTRRV